MTPERLFSLLNLVTLVAWLPLLFLPRTRWATNVVPVLVSPVLVLTFLFGPGGLLLHLAICSRFEVRQAVR